MLTCDTFCRSGPAVALGCVLLSAGLVGAQPQITNVSPMEGPTQGGVPIMLSGSGFGTCGAVSVGGRVAHIWSYIDSQIVFTLPPGEGMDQPVRVHVGTEVSSPQMFHFDAPFLGSIDPPNGPSAGGTTLTLTGTNLGFDASVTIGGRPARRISQTHSSIQVELPPGQGKDLDVEVIVGGRPGNVLNFSYSVPVVSEVLAPVAPITGMSPVIIRGQHFGLEGEVTIGGNPATILNWAHDVIVVMLPPGQGTAAAVTVTTGGQSSLPSPEASLDYDPPFIETLTPPTGPTAGDVEIVLTGRNFGTGSFVLVGADFCTPVSPILPDTITCMLPPGQGEDLPVSVSVGGRTSNIVRFSYDPPELELLLPPTGPTAGQVALTIQGSNFGTSGSVTVGGQPCLTSGYTHDEIICTLPPGAGADQPVQVVVSGRPSNMLPFTYAPPVIGHIHPDDAPTNGDAVLTLTGSNFSASPVVTVDDKLCSLISVSPSHDQLSCDLPAGQGRDLTVRVSAGGQAGERSDFSYAAPEIDFIDPPGGSTSGGEVRTIVGDNFGLSGVLLFDGRLITPGTWSHDQITFTLPPGQGLNRPVRVVVAGQESNVFPFSYSGPVINSVAGGIRPTEGGAPLILSGLNFGTCGKVTVGGVHAAIIDHTDTQITATLPPGEGTNVPVALSVGGQSSQAFPIDYDGPVATVLLPNAGPIAGGVPITLTGANFGLSLPEVRVGPIQAPVLHRTHNTVTFTLPGGSVGVQGVNVHVGTRMSGAILFEYLAPPVPGDLDGDGDVDMDDFAIFQACMSGEAIPADPDCAP